MKQCKEIQDIMPQAACHELKEEEKKVFDQHLEQCSSCLAEFDKFRGTLDMLSRREIPDPGKKYWETFTDRLEDKITESVNHSKSKKLFQQVWLNTGFRFMKVAALIMIGVMLGYVFFAFPPDGQQHTTSLGMDPAEGRMVASVDETTEYLENAKVLLLGIVNLDTENMNNSNMDFSIQQNYSRSMIQRTAVLRENLKGNENQRVMELINELEMIFLQLANYEQDFDLEAVELIRGGVEDQAILLKIDIEKLILNKKQRSEAQSASEKI